MLRGFLSALLRGSVLLIALPACPQSQTSLAPADAKSSATPIKVYLASPLGFSEGSKIFMYQLLIPKLTSIGVNVENPWDTPQALDKEIDNAKKITVLPSRRKAWVRVIQELGSRNARLIQNAQGVVAVLDGADIDSGTAAEIGYASALGKWIIGYRGDSRRTGEDETSEANLQVEYFILHSGGEVVHSLEDLKTALRKKIGR